MADDFNSDLEQIRKFNELAGNAYIPVNLSRDRGNVLTDRNQIILDRSALNPFDFAKKYGADVAREMDQLDLSQATTALMQDDDRNTDQLNHDLVNNIASGVNNTLGGIAVFGASAISPNTGAAASELLNGYNEWNRSLSTEDIQNSAELDSIRASLDKQDSVTLFEEERRTVGDFTAGLNMFGRDALQAAVRMTEDPRTVETLAEQGIGSLLAAGPTAKALGAIGQAVAKTAGIETGLISAQSMLPATIGMMEGGNAFSSAVGEVLDTSFEDLEKTSPEFREMVANGMSKDAARRRLATRAGYVAEAIQTPIAAAAGTLVSKFEAAPLAVKPITDLVQNIAREGLEEGIQSATGQIAQNVGIKTGANPEKDMLEDVAAGTVQGAVSGSLSAGVTAAPGAAFKTVVDAAKSAGQNLDKLLVERGNRVQTANDAASPVSDENLTAAAESLPAKATEVAASITTLIPPDADEASKAEAARYAERIIAASTISPENLGAIPEHIRNELPETSNLFTTVKSLGDYVANEENSKADRVTAALSILTQMAAKENLLGDLPAFLAQADKTSDQYKQFEEYNLVLNNVLNAPSVQQAVQWAMEGNLQEDVEITSERAVTPEGQQDIQNAVNIAENIPSAVNEKVNDQILFMADRGDITLTDIQRNALLSAKAVLDAQRAFEKEMGAKEDTPYITQAAETVSKQIETEGGARPYQYSLEGHVRRINEAKGNKAALKDRLRDAVLFAMHMQNKASSLAQAITNSDGKQVPYKTLGNKGWLPEKNWNSVYYIPGNENSKKIAQRIHAEATAMASLSNSLKALYPEYNIPEIIIPAFNFEAQATPTVVSQEAESTPVVSQEEPKVDTQPVKEDTVTEPEVVNQPEVAEKVAQDEPVEASEPVDEETPTEQEEAPTEAPEAKEPPKEKLKLNLKKTYADLLGSDNRFRKSFAYPGDAVSRLVTSPDPIADVQEVLDVGQEAIEGIAGTKIQYTLNDDHIEAYTELLDHAETMVNTINSNLQVKLDEKLKNGKTLRELINSGDESSLYWATTRPFSIMEKDGEKFKYNDNLIRSAVLAGLDWAINDYLVKGYDDEDAIAKATGINVASFPSAMLVVEEDGQQKLSPIDLVNEYNLGMSFARAKRDIARKIQSFWGVNVLPDADIGHAQGILEGIAGEVMTALEEEGFFTGETLTINYEIESKGVDGKLVIKEAEYTLHRYRNDKRDEPTKDLFKSFNGAKRLLGDLVVVDNQHEFYVDRLPPAAPEFQLRSQVTKNSEKARKALDIQASRPFYLDNSFADFIFEGVGRDAVMSFLGGWPGVNPRYVNGQHLRTIEGVNTTISSAYDTTEAHIEEIKNIAKTKGVDPSEIPSYYSNNMTSVGRLQFDGPSNVQSDKLSRHLISSTKEVVDITDPEMLKRVWMTVGQGLGIKTEYQYGENVQRDAVRMTLLPPDGVKGTGKFYKAVNAIEAWYKEPNQINAKRALNEVITASGGDNSIHLLFSLHQAARIKMALDNGTGKEFVNYGYLEADGKTNGLANALVMLNGNMFTGSNLAKLERIGLFIGSGKKTLADYFATKAPETPVDLYTAIAKRSSTYLQEYADSIADNKEVKALYDDMITIFKELDIGISFNENGNIEISRSVTKNPSTITIYGSGSNGIAGNIASELVKMVYAEVTAAMQANAPFKESFTSAWDRLLTSSIYKNKSGELKVYNSGKKRGNRQIGPDYALSYTDFKNLRGNLHEMFIKHMVKAIDEEVMNDVLDSTNLIQRTTNAQSIVLNTLFNAEIVKFIAEKKKAGLWKDGDFLSRNELKQIQNKLEKFAPTLTVGDQNYYLSAGETTEIARDSDGKSIKINGETVSPPKEFGSDLAGKYRSAAYYFGPGMLGVGGMPKLNIGNGDGQMMITAIADYGVEGLPVFDGFHMRPSRFDKDSEAMNRAVFDTWQNNPMRSLAEAFAQFVEADPISVIKENNLFIDDFIENMSRNYNGPGGAIMTFSDIMSKFKKELEQMQEIARNHDIRVIATNMLSVSVDQMSSAGTPYFIEGTYPSEITSAWSHEDKAVVLNKVIAYLEGVEMPKTPTGIPQGITLDLEAGEYRPKLPEAKQIYYAEDDGVQVISTNDLPVFIDTLQKRVSKQHKEMLTNTLKRLKDSGYKVVFGMPSDLRRWENRNFPMNTDNIPYEGKTDVGNKIIYISNESVETIVHELIHAATFDKVNAYYKNKGTLSAADISSLDRIEGLMKEWLAAEPEGDVSVEFEQANGKALLTIRDRLSKGQKAAALNEFMAWSLANKDIAEAQKTVKVKSPVLRIVGDALIALWRLIWGNKFAPVPGDTIYSNLRFNTRVLLATPYKGVQVAADLEGISLYQSANYGNNDRINALTVKLVNKINGFIQSAGNLVDVTLRQKEYQSNLADALDTTQMFMAQGFHMNMQEKFLFQVVQALLATNAKVNSNSLSAIQDIYAHVMENLKIEDFMQDRAANEPADRYQAQRKYDALTGVFGTKVDSSKRSNLMPTFLALAMVDEQFRSVIAGMKKPEKYKSDRESLDGILENLGMAGVDLLGSTMSTAGANLGLLGALDALVNELGGIAADQQSFIEQNISKTGDAFDDYIASWRDKTGKKLLDANKGKSGAKARAARFVGTLFNDEASSKWVDGIISKINKVDGLNTVRELVAEIVGPRKDNAAFYRMINRVRAAIQQTRQQYREHLPERLAEAFSRKLSADEWTLMFKGFAKTDLSALFDHIGLKKTIDMIEDNTARADLIKKLEDDLTQLNAADAPVQMRKGKELAEAMITGKTSINYLRNAYAVAHMLNEKTSAILGSKDAAVSILDQLITLYAVDNLPTSQRKSLAELINNERKGVEKTLSFLIGERRDELDKTQGRARINGYKGYIPSDNQLGVSMIVADDQEGSRLRSMGYTRIGDYVGSSADTSRVSRGYYFSPVSGKAKYNQGVLQTVHQTASGVDPHTGYSMGLTAGRITHRDMVKSIARNMVNTPASAENLHPIFDTNGDVVAYERGIDPEKLIHLNQNTDLSQMMGAWVGRQIEERLAYHFNRQLIDVLKKHYDEGKAQGRGDEYIDLISSKDPIHQDTWALFSNSTRDEIKAVFGDKFMIRKDMLNDAVGYREASIGDLWTGTTRMKPIYAEAIRKRLIGMFGEKAFSYFVNSENLIKNVVTEAKVLIVVKSVIVPMGNMISNIHQLMLRGVPIRSIIHGLGSKTAELNDFIKRRKRQLELEADYRSAETINNTLQMRRIDNELRAIKDSYKRMSIYPLIEAGEFSAISDGGITQEDIALSEGRWGQFIEKLADKVPNALRVPAKYALLTRDTALFQGLNRAVQYGDFLGKAILYDDLVNRKKVNREDAVTKVSEEFVNYNRLAGRNRNYLESIGLMWFWNFKLRSIRTAVSMIRENPFRAFMYSNFGPDSVPLFGDIGSPLEDNALAIIGQGKAGYSIGPSMGLGSWSLNPWINIIH